jgi:pimeloyl-ACP methyl ester carboxylesterase
MDVLTAVHVAISLIGILSGLVAMFGMLNRQRFYRWTEVFLATTAATSMTGFFFPFHGFTPAIGVGIISLVVLAIATAARYLRHLAGSWRWLYVLTATVALYFNCFVLVVQFFQKLPALKALAPTQSEPPFAVAQLVVLIVFVVLAVSASIRFHPSLVRALETQAKLVATNVTSIVLTDTGHWLMEQRPAETKAALKKFFAN